MRPKHLYLLVEEETRELLSRLCLAREAINRGHHVVLGRQWWFFENFDRLPPGVALFKGNNRIQASQMAVAKRHGHLIASIEEEALVLADADEIRRLYEPAIEHLCDVIFAQGKFQADCLGELFTQASHKVIASGNPRLDLLRHPELRALALRAEPGTDGGIPLEGARYVLVNTNMSAINPSVADTLRVFERCEIAGLLDGRHQRDVDEFDEWCAWETENLVNLVRFIDAYKQSRGDVPIVVRPHPSENAEFWSDLYDADEQVSVIQDGNHLTWIEGAACVVHTSCTTGLEAYVMGKPVVTIKTAVPHWDARFVSNAVSQVADGPEQAVDMVLAAVSSSEATVGSPADANLVFNRYFRSQADSPNAQPNARLIIEALEQAARGRFEESAPLALTETQFRDAHVTDLQKGKVGFDAADIDRSMAEVTRALGGDNDVTWSVATLAETICSITPSESKEGGLGT